MIADRRRRRPQFLPSPAALTAQEQATAYNTAAAQQYAAIRENQLLEAERDTATIQAKNALATALGYQPGEPVPTFAELKMKWAGLPDHVKAGIYEKGGAQFVGEKEGMKLLAGNTQDEEVGMRGFTKAIAKRFVDGQIVQEDTKEGAKFFEMVDDPTDITGKRKIKQPLNAMQLKLLKKGFETGMIPNLEEATEKEVSPQRKMSVEEFQHVLDTRALQDSQPQIPVVKPSQLGETNLLDNKGSVTPIPSVAPQPDSALALRAALGAASQKPREIMEGLPQFVNDVETTIGDTGANVVNNLLLNPSNWLLRLAHGEKAPQIPKLPTSADDFGNWMTPIP